MEGRTAVVFMTEEAMRRGCWGSSGVGFPFGVVLTFSSPRSEVSAADTGITISSEEVESSQAVDAIAVAPKRVATYKENKRLLCERWEGKWSD